MSRILLVEDEPPIAKMTMRMLRAKGYDVLHTDSDVAAMELVRSYAPSLVLMDIVLEGSKSGLEVTRMIRECGETQHIPVIVLSASVLAEFQEAAFSAGANDVDTKPVEFPRLIGKIEKLVGR